MKLIEIPYAYSEDLRVGRPWMSMKDQLKGKMIGGVRSGKGS
jgi:hypothetical protein